jgi:hypothetical protein
MAAVRPAEPERQAPLSAFCQSVLGQLDVAESRCHVIHPGYAREIDQVEPPRRDDSAFRFLSVTNSHDLNRYGTAALVEAYDRAFAAGDDVTLILKDYGAAGGNTTIRDALARRVGGARIAYITEFTDKRELIRLYKSADAFVSAHRGEGFAMKMLDAMACGLPVITPLFGGPTAYCTTDNCLPVDFSLVPMGDCLDTRSLAIGNQPLWAEPDVDSLARQMRDLFEHRDRAAALGARGRASVVDQFSWDQAARRLIAVTTALRELRGKAPRAPTARAVPAERSPYWLGLRVSVVVPTHNRKEKLLRTLDALARQTVLPQEFEVIVVDDGSSDRTGDAWRPRAIGLRCPLLPPGQRRPRRGAQSRHREGGGRDRAVHRRRHPRRRAAARGAPALAHASDPAPGVAILGHIDWPEALPRTRVMVTSAATRRCSSATALIRSWRCSITPFSIPAISR